MVRGEIPRRVVDHLKKHRISLRNPQVLGSQKIFPEKRDLLLTETERSVYGISIDGDQADEETERIR